MSSLRPHPTADTSAARPNLPAGARAEVLGHRVLYADPRHYCAWPAIVRARNGDLVLAFTRTEQHLSPDGSIVVLRSSDNGKTWTGPVVACDTPIDDRESGLTIGPRGEILLHVWSTFWTRANYEALGPEAYPREMLDRWIGHVGRADYRKAGNLHGSCVLVSEDNGLVWSSPVAGPDTIHGGVALLDGSLLVAAYRRTPSDVTIHRASSSRGPWTRVATIPSPRPDELSFGEPHVARMPSGRIVVMIRATARVYNDADARLYLWESYSDDNGRTWAGAFPTPLWGFPPHLLVLSDGRLMVSYGYRRAPFGQRAAISADGISWSAPDEIVLRADAPNHDLGYPASVELSPGSILTVYYQKPALDPADQHAHKVAIMATTWRPPQAPKA